MAVAAASTTVSPIPTAASAVRSSPAQRRTTRVRYVAGLNSFGGLKAHGGNAVVSLGLPVSTEQSFANIVSSLKQPAGNARGGALTSTCNAIAEIFRIAAIMPALVLVGVAVGFVLLRIEAFVEEAE